MENFVYDESKNRYFRILPSQAIYNQKFTKSFQSEQLRVIEGQNTSDPRTVALRASKQYKPQFFTQFHTDHIENFITHPNLVTGSRFGCLATDSYTSPKGRSVTGLVYKDRIFASASDDRGSIIATSDQNCHYFLPKETVYNVSLCASNSALISSTRGLRIWDFSADPQLIFKSSLQTHCEYNSLVLGGTRNGSMSIIDPRTHKKTANFPLGKGAVTHILPLNENLIVCTGLSDQMALYDLRSTEILRFAYSNNSILNHGACVLKHNLVAVANDTGKVRFYDGMTGSVLKETNKFKIPPSCITPEFFSSRNKIYKLKRDVSFGNTNIDSETEMLYTNLNS